MKKKHWYLAGAGVAAGLFAWLLWRRNYKTVKGVVAIAYDAPNGEVQVGREPITVLGDQAVRTLGSAQNGYVPVQLTSDLRAADGNVGDRAGTWWFRAADLA